MKPREMKDGSGWYVLLQWEGYPPEQVGWFSSEEEAQQWIEQASPAWIGEH